VARSGLTDKQSAFVREYLVDLNATQAAVRAGYSARTADKVGSELLGKTRVREAVDEALRGRAVRVEVRQDDVLRELLNLALVDIGDAFDGEGRLKDLSAMPPGVRRAISSIEVEEHADEDGILVVTRKLRFWDKPKSLELLGKHLKLFTDRVEHSGALTLEQLVAQSMKKPEGT
jgi:phage terminase small subunit